MSKSARQLTRRMLLQIGFSVPPVLLAACTAPLVAPPRETADSPAPESESASQAATTTQSSAVTQALPPTPSCADDDEPTIAQTEGPFYTPNTPERTSFLEEGLTGTRLVVSGQVLSTGCQPLAGAVLDFWHCDDQGVYDNAGYRLRGHQFTTTDGVYRLETILPGLYTGRTRHIHVKVQGQNTRLLTTQLYFPDEPSNARDGIFHPSLVMDLQNASAGGKTATFNFVLATA